MTSFGSGPTGQSGPVAPENNGFSNKDMANGPTGDAQKLTLWMGELEPWMDETFVKGVFLSTLAEQVQVKVIRDKSSGNAGYCFVEFNNPQAAQRGIQELNGQQVPNSTRVFKLNWATGGGIHDRRDERAPEFSIFVGDLGPDINEFILVSLFQSRFPSCKSAKIMTDNQSGQSRGYGFVRFSSQEDQERALVEMQGVYCGNRPMRISTATPKSRAGGPGGPPQGQPWAQQMNLYHTPNLNNNQNGYNQHDQRYGGGLPQMNQFTDPNNTTVFVGGLSGYVTEDELRSFFQGFGEITYVKIPPGKGCGFVQFVHRHAAEMAINQMQGYPIGNSRVRLSWGRSQNNSGIGTPYRPAPPPPHYMGQPPYSQPNPVYNGSQGGNYAPYQMHPHMMNQGGGGMYGNDPNGQGPQNQSGPGYGGPPFGGHGGPESIPQGMR